MRTKCATDSRIEIWTWNQNCGTLKVKGPYFEGYRAGQITQSPVNRRGVLLMKNNRASAVERPSFGFTKVTYHNFAVYFSIRCCIFHTNGHNKIITDSCTIGVCLI